MCVGPMTACRGRIRGNNHHLAAAALLLPLLLLTGAQQEESRWEKLYTEAMELRCSAAGG